MLALEILLWLLVVVGVVIVAVFLYITFLAVRAQWQEDRDKREEARRREDQQQYTQSLAPKLSPEQIEALQQRLSNWRYRG